MLVYSPMDYTCIVCMQFTLLVQSPSDCTCLVYIVSAIKAALCTCRAHCQHIRPQCSCSVHCKPSQQGSVQVRCTLEVQGIVHLECRKYVPAYCVFNVHTVSAYMGSVSSHVGCALRVPIVQKSVQQCTMQAHRDQ